MPTAFETLTALVTPTDGRGEIDWTTYESLLGFQARAGVSGVVVGGTTGESPTLTTNELERSIEIAMDRLPSTVEVIAATGRNRLDETLELTAFAADHGVKSVLLVDPYYNGPSSVEIRREHLEPVCDRFPEIGIIPYVIPSRTGTRLEPRDIARLLGDGRRIVAVKDATGDDAYALELRRRAPHLPILSGDDARTLPLMADPAIRADGVVSVVSNLAPTSVVELVRAARRGDWIGASRRAQALRPLFESVTLTVVERLDGGEEAVVRSRNPVPIKAALSLLGARVGRCRPPLGRLTPAGIRRLVSALESVWTLHPEVLTEFAEWLPCDVPERLADRTRWAELSYASC